jgi:DNA-binding NarL/FixJ family response regulator
VGISTTPHGTGFATPAVVENETLPYAVVTFSRQPSVAYFLKGVLDCAGFTTIAASSSPQDLEAAVERMHPDAIVYDVSFPFAENWDQLQELRATLGNIPVVITTSEARELYRRVGVSSAIEIFRRPDDVTEIREAITGAIRANVSSYANAKAS